MTRPTAHRPTVPRVAVIGGGTSGEHEVSLASAAGVVRAVRALGAEAVPLTLDVSGRWRDDRGGALTPAQAVARLTGCDVAFPVLHGVAGEDGTVAGLLVLTGVPFVGSPVRAGALSTDKWVTGLVARALGVATAPGVLLRPGDAVADLVAEATGPLVVKPTTGGSSDGVTLVDDVADLPTAVARARAVGDDVLVESYVSGREVDLAIFRDAGGVLRLGAALEVGRARGGVFDRTTKYDGSARFEVPARVSEDELRSLRSAARALYGALGCSGVARFDFFLTPAGVVLNEVNAAPGFTESSQVPRMFAAVGLGYADLVAELVDAALAGAGG